MKKKVVNPIIKDEVTFLQTTSGSGGTVTELEILLMPGGKNPLHFHRTYSETFTAVSGELGLRVGKKERKILQPGESFTVPPLQLHSFFNPGDTPIKFIVAIKPGHEGFENTICIGYGLVADKFEQKKSTSLSFRHLGLLLTMGDMGLPGMMGLLVPIFKLAAKRVKASGEEQQLIEKYCR